MALIDTTGKTRKEINEEVKAATVRQAKIRITVRIAEADRLYVKKHIHLNISEGIRALIEAHRKDK